MKENKIALNFRIEPDLLEDVKDAAQIDKRTITSFVKIALSDRIALVKKGQNKDK